MARSDAKDKPGVARRLVEMGLAPLATRAWRQGVLGGQRRWLGVGLAVMVLRRARGRTEDVVYSETLAPGHYLVVTHEPPPPSRRARRRARRRAQRRQRDDEAG